MSDLEEYVKVVGDPRTMALTVEGVTEERLGTGDSPLSLDDGISEEPNPLESRVAALEAEVKSLREDMYKVSWAAGGGEYEG